MEIIEAAGLYSEKPVLWGFNGPQRTCESVLVEALYAECIPRDFFFLQRECKFL